MVASSKRFYQVLTNYWQIDKDTKYPADQSISVIKTFNDSSHDKHYTDEFSDYSHLRKYTTPYNLIVSKEIKYHLDKTCADPESFPRGDPASVMGGNQLQARGGEGGSQKIYLLIANILDNRGVGSGPLPHPPLSVHIRNYDIVIHLVALSQI